MERDVAVVEDQGVAAAMSAATGTWVPGPTIVGPNPGASVRQVAAKGRVAWIRTDLSVMAFGGGGERWATSAAVPGTGSGQANHDVAVWQGSNTTLAFSALRCAFSALANTGTMTLTGYLAQLEDPMQSVRWFSSVLASWRSQAVGEAFVASTEGAVGRLKRRPRVWPTPL